jgi:hypothetical protein
VSEDTNSRQRAAAAVLFMNPRGGAGRRSITSKQGNPKEEGGRMKDEGWRMKDEG